MKIIGTGLSGLVGSRIVELLGGTFEFTNLSLETGVDITNAATVDLHIGQSDAPWIFHFAAMTDVDGAEKERDLKEDSKSWIVNVKATQHVADAAKKYGKKILYISTDFVFDGTKEFYTEEDVPNPQGWYAITKYEGEKIIAQGTQNLIIRIANPYLATAGVRPDFVHKIMERLLTQLPVSAPKDQQFIPTFVDDIAHAIEVLVKGDAHGIYHVVGTGSLSPYDVATKIASALKLDPAVVGSTTFEEFFKNRAPRPRYANLKNDKLRTAGVHMSTFDEGLATMVLLREKTS
jgi:dTDP-4-dehydrorhamnose reductase